MLPNGFYRDLTGVDPAELEVVCYGVVRSGSTLVYQLISGICPAGVAKTHRYSPHRVKTVASYRDFRDVTVSLWRAADPTHCNRRMTSDEVEHYAGRCARHASVLDRFCERGDVCLLRYEEFVKDPENIFSSLKTSFGMAVPETRIQELARQYSLAENRRRADALGTFSRHDPGSQIHGNHIFTGEPGTWRQFVETSDQAVMQTLLNPWLTRYNYI
jgi:hypothetical protein